MRRGRWHWPRNCADRRPAAAGPSREPARFGLSDEQHQMVCRLAGDPAGLLVVVGPAGRGKTAALRAAHRQWRRADRPVYGAAVAAVAARRLEHATGIASSSLARLLADLDRVESGTGAPAGLATGAVLVLDEAGMVGTRQLARLMTHVRRAGATLVLTGDPRQVPEVEAGGVFALALLGGGTLAAGGAGVAGGAALLTGLVAGPAVLPALGGVVWAARRNRQQQQELRAKLNEAEAQLDNQARGVQAFMDLVGRAAEILDYIAVHGAHARARWSKRLEASTHWDDLSPAQQEQYDDFVQLCAARLAVATLDVQRLLVLSGDELDQEIGLMDQVLEKSDDLVRSRA